MTVTLTISLTCRMKSHEKIVSTLSVKLREDEQKRLARKGTEDIKAYDFVLRGAEYLSRYTKVANAYAQTDVREIHRCGSQVCNCLFTDEFDVFAGVDIRMESGPKISGASF